MTDQKALAVVIDGQGGGIGRALVEQLKKQVPELHVRALGTNAMATAAMLKAGADDGATGENAVIYNVHRARMILGPVGILASNGLLGELTPAMAAAIGESDAVKILVPSQRCAIRLAIGKTQPLQSYLADAVRLAREELQNGPEAL